MGRHADVVIGDEAGMVPEVVRREPRDRGHPAPAAEGVAPEFPARPATPVAAARGAKGTPEGKNLAQFQSEDAACRSQAQQQLGAGNA